MIQTITWSVLQVDRVESFLQFQCNRTLNNVDVRVINLRGKLSVGMHFRAKSSCKI